MFVRRIAGLDHVEEAIGRATEMGKPILYVPGIGTMADGLRQMGIKIDESEDGAEIHYGEPTGATVDSHGDHRVAMAFAVAGTIADAAVRICNVDAVNTSFPAFSDVMDALGANVTEGPSINT